MPLFDIISAYLSPNEGNTAAKELHSEWNTFSGEVKINGGGPRKWGDIGPWFPVPKKENKKTSPYEVVGADYDKKGGYGGGSAGKGDYPNKDGYPKKDSHGAEQKPDPVRTLSGDRQVRMVPFGTLGQIPIYYLSSPTQKPSTGAYDNKPADGSQKPGYGANPGYVKSTSADPKSSTSSSSSSTSTPPSASSGLKEGDCMCMKSGSMVKVSPPPPLRGMPQSPDANKPSTSTASKPTTSTPAPQPLWPQTVTLEIPKSDCFADYLRY
jgi:hypothetical protein